MKGQLLTFVAILLCQILSAQTPEWTNQQIRKTNFSDTEYIKGYAEYKNQQNQTQEVFLEKLKGYAQKELIQSVQTTIESASALNSKEENGTFTELFMMSSMATCGMTITGLKFETFYDKKTKTGYAFAYANRMNVLDNYKGILNQTILSIKQKLDQAKALNGQQSKQLKQLNSCYPDFRNIEETQSIMYALKPSISESELKFGELKTLKTEVENLKASLEKGVTSDINEAAGILAFTLKDQLSADIKNIRLVNLSYQDTKMGSSFSRRFSKTLEQKLSSEAGLNVVTNVNSAGQGQEPIMLTGTYWEEGNALKIILVLKDTKNNKTLASSEAKLSTEWLKSNNINYKPENFQQAYSTMKAFKTDEVQGGGLIAEIWTNKGDENLIYTEGDLMKLFVRVNRECYIRVIYHMADGSRVLLVDNYYISSDKVNTVYELPFEFECAEPFGVETLQLNAQTKAFDKLNTTEQYGYDFISEGLNEILVNTRGFKKVTTDVQKAEKRVVITTMKE